MGDFLSGAAYLPPSIRNVVIEVPARIQAVAQEIRLRAGAPVVLSTPSGELLVTKSGQVTELSSGELLTCDPLQLEDCFQRLCEYSVHTHQQEIKDGYVSTRSGCRAGIAGSVVAENGAVVTMRHITSICIRIGPAARRAARPPCGGADRPFRPAQRPDCRRTLERQNQSAAGFGQTAGQRPLGPSLPDGGGG